MGTATAIENTTTTLEGRIVEAKLKVIEAEQHLDAVVHEIRGCEDLLSELTAKRAEECISLAEGNARANPAKLDTQIVALKDRIAGLEELKRRREAQVTDAKCGLFDLQDAWGVEEASKALARERSETETLVASTREALRLRDEADRKIIDGLAKLRGRQYRDPRNKSFAYDRAFEIQRNSNGMR